MLTRSLLPIVRWEGRPGDWRFRDEYGDLIGVVKRRDWGEKHAQKFAGKLALIFVALSDNQTTNPVLRFLAPLRSVTALTLRFPQHSARIQEIWDELHA